MQDRQPSTTAAVGVTRRRYLWGSTATIGTISALSVATGCGVGEQSAPRAERKLTGELRWLTWAPGKNYETRQKGMDGLSGKFPGAKVTLEPVGNAYFGPYADKLRSGFASGTAPDLFLAPDFDMPSYLKQGTVRDIAPYVKRDKYDLSDFPQSTIDLYRHKGGLYGLPDNSSTIGTFINLDLFRRAGIQPPAPDMANKAWTLDAAAEAAQKIARLSPSDASPQARYWGLTPNRSTSSLVAWIRTNGGDFAKKDYTESTLHLPAATEALQYLADLQNKLRVDPAPADKAGNMRDVFVEGRLGLYEACVCQLNVFQDTMTQEFDAAVRPMGEGSRRVDHLYAFPQMIWKETKLPELAWEALKYFEDEAMVLLVKEGILQGTKIKAHHQKYFLQPGRPPKNAQIWIESTQKYAQPLRGTTNWTDIEALLREGLAPLWAGTATARQSVQEIKPRLDALLKEGRVEA